MAGRRAGDALSPRDNFFSRRWRGDVPQPVLFWRDMLGVGSALNVAASLAALAVVASGGSMALAVGLHFAPLPYNLFLFMALWRAPWRSALTAAVGLVWLGVMTVI